MKYEFDAKKFRFAVLANRTESQPKLAKRCGVSRWMITQIESRTYRPGIDVFLSICRGMNLSPSDFITGDSASREPGAYSLDMDALRKCLEQKEGKTKPWPYPAFCDRPISYETVWRIRTERTLQIKMGTWLGVSEWLQRPPTEFLKEI